MLRHSKIMSESKLGTRYTIEDEEYVNLITNRILHMTDGHTDTSARLRAINIIKRDSPSIQHYKKHLQDRRSGKVTPPWKPSAEDLRIGKEIMDSIYKDAGSKLHTSFRDSRQRTRRMRSRRRSKLKSPSRGTRQIRRSS